MKIVVDSRETLPLSFTKCGVISDVIVSKLEVGDYQAEYSDGSRSKTVFERKSLADLFKTMTSEYKRFKNEMKRARELNMNLVVIVEATFSEVLEGYTHSTWSGASMVKKLGTLWFKHKLPTLFMNGRDEMKSYITQWFIAEGYSKMRGDSMLSSTIEKEQLNEKAR